MAALTLEERIAKLQEKQAQLKAQEKALKAKQSAEKRKKDTHRKIVIGGAVEFPLQDEDIQLLITFLHDQEKRGYFFSSALGYSHETDNTGKVIYKKKNPLL